MSLTQQDINNLVKAKHESPHAVLGLNMLGDDRSLTISCFFPAAINVEIIASHTGKIIGKLKKVHSDGLFSLKLRRKNKFKYQLKVTKATSDDKTSYEMIDDPFSFTPILGDLDIYLLNEGTHLKPYSKLGAHVTNHQNVDGVSFAVWAPNASYVAVVGDFNDWDGRCHPMQNIVINNQKSGYWSIFIPQAVVGQYYKFKLKDPNGNILPLKADPYATQSQYRPETASIISAEKVYPWQDQKWLAKREQRNNQDAPISIYEVHLGSWRKDANNHYLNYREIANQLIPYVLEMGFTHIQLMPISEYPFDGSWGYQPVGLFAPTSRFGNEDDFQYFVDQCHNANIGLLIDWVPGHFPSDPHGLAQFDGTHLFEHEDPRQGFHPDWNTLIYNYGRTEVTNFLRASAMHWLDKFHVDGIRVDAVASMLYLDYSRKDGEWIPNKHGGRENLEAIAFLQQFNCELYHQYPGCVSIAEESTSWPGVSKPVHEGGLGFGYKWNMGWMNDSLTYMKRDPIHRCHHHNELSFSLVYAFDENFILPLSHDEVVHGKGSLIAKMPGDAWQQFANLRAYYGFMWAHPGKKLLFMGCEFAQGKEWDHDHQLDWHQLDIHWHSGVQRLIKDLNKIYTNTPALYQQDCSPEGFLWLDHKNAEQSIYSFIRFDKSHENPVVVICNFTPTVHKKFKVGVPIAGKYIELINSDAEVYSGANHLNTIAISSHNTPWQDQPYSIDITVPALSTVMFSLAQVN
ncbi:1,4-alpha-glucan branching protein GlgB [Thalassotalea profundi]|uniref:1,4-alpha-glucan branching enzyme GlgB n=1 Tax=Thalassotalea profundi TaxID=2036687 RepID=A0ABQ3IFG6_9GAMM|nr:1,4-alpha-glucan branching protein GlgB [Thalassotalea profundi]GHE78083.1 1,4-alpha-glucan branching enzyme GlgB [Thalassotalea profundi]